MENVNTYKAIVTGMIILFAGTVAWLLISRQRISDLTAELDRTSLKNEKLLYEGALKNKDLDEAEAKIEKVSLTMTELEKTAKHQAEVVSTQTVENRRIQRALELALEKQREDKSLTEELTQKLSGEMERNSVLNKQMAADANHIRSLMSSVAALEAQLDDMITRSIDQTLVLAKKRNDKVTSKARRTDELVANLVLPSKLNQLSFTVEDPDGSVLSTEAGSASVRQIADDQSVTASLTDTPLLASPYKKMELVYKPDAKLKRGTYSIKIYNASDYVGTMHLMLR